MYLPLAIEIANDRTREAEMVARRREAGRAAAGSPEGPRRPSRVRRLAARPFSALADATHAMSEAATTAATLIMGRAN